MITQAKNPFHFFSRLTLTVLTGRRAADLPGLLDGLRGAPDMVVYQHTHRFLQQHQYLVPEPPNDFAYWVTHVLQDEELGERLAAIDTVRFDTLAALRDALASTIAGYLEGSPPPRTAPPGREFHFMRAVRFSLPTRHRARDLREFLDGLGAVSLSSLYLHVFEAKMRPPYGVNDFSRWFKEELGEAELAEDVNRLDPYTQTMEGLRNRIAGLVRTRLEEGDRGRA
jgi:hypothetical protein